MGRITLNDEPDDEVISVRSSKPKVTISFDRKKPSKRFERYHALVHGPKKIGKTLLADAQLCGVRTFFIQCDPEQAAYGLMEERCTSWNVFEAILKDLEKQFSKDKRKVDRVCVDRADVLWDDCVDYTCDRIGVDELADAGYGKGFEAVKRAYRRGVKRLLALPCSVWFTCHSEWKTVKKNKSEIDRQILGLNRHAESIINGAVDATFALDYDGGKRILHLQGSDEVVAGHRMDFPTNKHFRDVKTGKPLDFIYLGNTPEQGYLNLVGAFNNQYSEIKGRLVKKVS